MKRPYPGIFALLLLMAAAAWYLTTAPVGPPTINRPHSGPATQFTPDFAFYVLALSWSPTFCETSATGSNREQCDTGLRRGFIVHGLWPQNENGYPEFCGGRQPDRVPSALGRSVADIMPGMGLVGHQWRKHGTCSGLSQRDYFALVRKARDKVTIPESLDAGRQRQKRQINALEEQLIAANPGLTNRAVSVTCNGNRLDELRICLTKDLTFRDCPKLDRRACSLDTITIPALR